MLNIGDVLAGQNLKEKLSTDAHEKDLLQTAWQATMGESCGSHTIDLKCRNGVLFISMDSQVWQQELLMHDQSEIVTAMAAATGRNIVKIKIKAGR